MSRCSQCGMSECCGGDMEDEIARLREGLVTLRAVLAEPYAAQVDDPDGNRERVEQVEDVLAEMLDAPTSRANDDRPHGQNGGPNA